MEATEHTLVRWTAPATEDPPAQNVSGAQAEKPCLKPNRGPGHFTTWWGEVFSSLKSGHSVLASQAMPNGRACLEGISWIWPQACAVRLMTLGMIMGLMPLRSELQVLSGDLGRESRGIWSSEERSRQLSLIPSWRTGELGEWKLCLEVCSVPESPLESARRRLRREGSVVLSSIVSAWDQVRGKSPCARTVMRTWLSWDYFPHLFWGGCFSPQYLSPPLSQYLLVSSSPCNCTDMEGSLSGPPLSCCCDGRLFSLQGSRVVRLPHCLLWAGVAAADVDEVTHLGTVWERARAACVPHLPSRHSSSSVLWSPSILLALKRNKQTGNVPPPELQWRQWQGPPLPRSGSSTGGGLSLAGAVYPPPFCGVAPSHLGLVIWWKHASEAFQNLLMPSSVWFKEDSVCAQANSQEGSGQSSGCLWSLPGDLISWSPFMVSGSLVSVGGNL